MNEPLVARPARRRAALALAAALVLGGAPGTGTADAAIWPVVEPAPTPTDDNTGNGLAPAPPRPSESEVRATVKADVAKLVDKGGLGAAASVRITDVASGRTIYSSKPGTPRIAASTTKLFHRRSRPEARWAPRRPSRPPWSGPGARGPSPSSRVGTRA